ncbi:MAG: 4-demethylwyosine synthase TYW1, partial [Methanoculleus sp.]
MRSGTPSKNPWRPLVSMHSEACKALRKQGYQFVNTTSSAAVKPCMW